MADDPVGHEAAVAAAGLADAIGVDGGIGFEDRIGKVHQVLIVYVPVAAPDVRKSVVAAVAALGVAEEDEITLPRPVLHLVIEHGTVDGLGAAVDVEDGGIALGGVIVHWFEHPALYGQALALHRQGLGLGHVPVRQSGPVKVGEALRFPGGKVAEIQLLGSHVVEAHTEGLAVRYIEAVHGPGLGEHGGGPAVRVQAIEKGVPAPGGQVVEAVPHRHRLPAPAQAAVAAHAVIEAVLRREQKLHLPGVGVQLVHIVVFVEAVALALAAEDQDPVPHGLEPGEHEGIGVQHLPNFAGI